MELRLCRVKWWTEAHAACFGRCIIMQKHVYGLMRSHLNNDLANLELHIAQLAQKKKD